ncbi:helix-turn-helix transcriptional regulator, partial [Acinetobacter baumannii]
HAAKLLAANVRRLRKERDWTQGDLAAEADVEQVAISLIESARANPTLLVIEDIARALAVRFVELFDVCRDSPSRVGSIELFHSRPAHLWK